jgi:predicted transcriptional regulator
MTQNSKSGYIRTQEQALIDTEALRLRSLGYTYQRIADEMGVTKTAAYERVNRALAAIPLEEVERYRTIQREQLDRLMASWLPEAIAGNPKAAEIVLKIIEKRSKLEGTDQPIKHEVLTLDAIQAEILRLEAELADTPAEA